jgi:hypothetical protein
MLAAAANAMSQNGNSRTWFHVRSPGQDVAMTELALSPALDIGDVDAAAATVELLPAAAVLGELVARSHQTLYVVS